MGNNAAGKIAVAVLSFQSIALLFLYLESQSKYGGTKRALPRYSARRSTRSQKVEKRRTRKGKK